MVTHHYKRFQIVQLEGGVPHSWAGVYDFYRPEQGNIEIVVYGDSLAQLTERIDRTKVVL